MLFKGAYLTDNSSKAIAEGIRIIWAENDKLKQDMGEVQRVYRWGWNCQIREFERLVFD